MKRLTVFTLLAVALGITGAVAVQAQDIPSDPVAVPVPDDHTWKLSKSSRLVSYEDAWTRLKGDRQEIPLLEHAGDSPWVIMKRIMWVTAVEVTPAASGSPDPEVRTTIKQSADDLMASYGAMSGPGISTTLEGPVGIRMNTFTFNIDDVAGTEKLPHSWFQDKSVHIVYMKESSPYHPYVLINAPIDEFRSFVTKLQDRRLFTIGWEIVPSGG